MNNELEEVRPEIISYDRPVMSIKEAEQELIELQKFIKGQMREDTDYGIIPGLTKPSLWKPGAEKLVNFHGLSVEYKESPSTIRDWDNNFFNFDYKCRLTSNSGRFIMGVGSCNSKEKKFITQDGYTLVNTIQKMAKKRAFIDAVLTATRASFYFTQDMEDNVNDDSGEDNTPQEKPQVKPKTRSGGKKLYPISPNQRKIAEKHGVDLSKCEGFADAKTAIAKSIANFQKGKPIRGDGKEALIVDEASPEDDGEW